MAAHLQPGFAEPVLEAQAAFRALMNALAFPGRPAAIAAPQGAPEGWPRGLAAAALALLDSDVSVWLDGTLAQGVDYLRFHTGCRFAEAPDAADFALIGAPEAAPFGAFKIGVDQYPDRSATLLIGCTAIEGGPRVTLTGPGIKTTATASPDLGGDAFWSAWRTNHMLYPLGFDAFFLDDARVVGLPRGVAAVQEG